jgi:acyl carrier protein
MEKAKNGDVSGLQAEIGAIWSQMLNTPQLSPEADFFDRGGDSLTALNMLFEVQSTLGIELSPTLLFENPTLQKFTTAVEQARIGQRENVQEGLI